MILMQHKRGNKRVSKKTAGMSDTLYFYQDVTHCKSGARTAGLNHPGLVVRDEGNEPIATNSLNKSKCRPSLPVFAMDHL